MTPTAPSLDQRTAPAAAPVDGVVRSLRLFRAFRVEQSEPESCYSTLAADTVAQLARHVDVARAHVLDVGGGPGYVADAVRGAGGRCTTVDSAVEELSLHGRRPRTALVARGDALPVRGGAVDVCCSLNTLEHVREPSGVLDELIRVTRSGGTIYLCVTTWWSPWGGHETSPWHYFGGARAARRYARRYGRPPKNRFGTSLFKIRVRDLLAWANADGRVELVEARPRYYPSWCRGVVRVPLLREVATWNLALVLRVR
jgi:SAM-dependent methyltransferase